MKRLLKISIALLAVMLIAVSIGLNTRPHLHHWQDLVIPPGNDEGDSLAITWLGTSTVVISDGTTTLMSDGFFSRQSLLALASGPISPDTARIDAVLDRHGIDSVDAILVTHSHYDHAMDAPWVAQRTGAVLMGSQSSANVGRGGGLPEQQIRVVTAGQAETVGDFRITFLTSNHVPQSRLIDLATGMDETIDAPLTPPAWLNAWKEGESWSVVIAHPRGNVLLQGSAGFVPGQLAGYRADVALVSSVGLYRQSPEFQQDYYHNTVEAVDADVVIPIHWDDFFTRLNGAQTPPLPWLVEHLAGSFHALQDPANAQGRDFRLLLPESTYYFRRQAAQGNR